MIICQNCRIKFSYFAGHNGKPQLSLLKLRLCDDKFLEVLPLAMR